ncbi:MICOS complex subunit Mic60-like isoform X2 [Plodia interpunctella]|uniref:MICOS complex subunit Mic60-like isoform X2 n=1 Tax=Plodia interpunctella TaxID=58824 RepID=UPI0023682382|nr:MICOS complex subunit Mic60-like isoform X2 [Plodia interpunctella]
MYKFTNSLNYSNLVLVRKQLGDGSCAALVVMRAPRRYATGEKCQHELPKSPKSKKLLWGSIGAAILTGAGVVYAKTTPEARNFLETNVPWADRFVALVYQENTTYWKFTVNQFNKVITTISRFMFGKEGVTPMEFETRPEQDLDKFAEEFFAKKTYESTIITTEKCEPEKPPVIKITKDMVELEQEMHENTKIAIDNYKIATKHCVNYNKALFQIVESSLEDLDKKAVGALAGAQSERRAAALKAREASTNAKCALDTLDRMIKAGVQAPPEVIAQTKRFIKQFRDDLSQVENEYKAELEKAVLSDKYWNKVEAARTLFKQELQALFPGIDLSARKLELKGDTDLFLLYMLRRIQFLQTELAELSTIRQLKIDRAIECRDDKMIIEAKVEDVIKREMLEKENEFQKKALEIQAEANRKQRAEVKKQVEIQQEVMQDKLNRKEKEIMNKFARGVSEQVEKERVIFKKELAAMAGKLKAIEQTLKQRAAAEAAARRSQSLWAAGEALLAATRRQQTETKVDKEIKALENAGKGDKLVETVLKGIPGEAREQGIATEKSLRDRFEVLEKTAIKVALVGRDGAALPIYFLSWLQSKLLFSKFSEIPQDELDNLPIDFSKLDTHDIILRAKYHMDHNNLACALRYMNLLQGAPRAAAQAWLSAAQRHLEIRQVAEAVMAHASVSALLHQ